MIEVDVWVRGTNHAVTHTIGAPSLDAGAWSDADIVRLLTEMLLALERQKNPGGEPPPVTLRGFNWIVTSYGSGVVLHVETQMGTASAGPFTLDEPALTTMVRRVVDAPASTVH